MKKLSVWILLAVFGATIFISCGGSDAKTAGGTKDKYEEKKESLEEMEKKNPLRFLSATVIKDKKNIFGQTVIKGEVNNSAKVATYKDVEIKILYYSKTAALLGESVENVYDNIAPGKSALFKSREWAPKGTDSVVLKITGAKVE
jgi:hypothetical protein